MGAIGNVAKNGFGKLKDLASGIKEAGAGEMDPKKMDLRQLLEAVKKLVEQLAEAEEAKAKQAGGSPEGGGETEGAQGVGNPVGTLEALMEELRERFRPGAVQEMADQMGLTDKVTSAENITAAAAAPVGMPSGFA